MGLLAVFTMASMADIIPKKMAATTVAMVAMYSSYTMNCNAHNIYFIYIKIFLKL